VKLLVHLLLLFVKPDISDIPGIIISLLTYLHYVDDRLHAMTAQLYP